MFPMTVILLSFVFLTSLVDTEGLNKNGSSSTWIYIEPYSFKVHFIFLYMAVLT